MPRNVKPKTKPHPHPHPTSATGMGRPRGLVIVRSSRINIRTYPEVRAKADRLGTERIEQLILAAPEPKTS